MLSTFKINEIGIRASLCGYTLEEIGIRVFTLMGKEAS